MSYVQSAVRADPRFPSLDEQAKILKVTGEHVTGFRDHMIFSTALGTGLREHEIVALNVNGVVQGAVTRAGHCEIRSRVQLETYKGRRQTKKASASQYVFLSKLLRMKMRKFIGWKKRNGESVAPDAPLFVSSRGTRISVRTLRHMVHTWQTRAGIERHHTFHGFRHACLSNLYHVTKDLKLVQKQARHTNVSTTSIYAHVSDDELRRAVEKLPS